MNRRQMAKLALGAAAWGALATRPARALPLNLPLGLQLYAMRKQLAADYGGTLQQIAALGFTEVEAAGYFGHSPAEIKAAMQAAGLRLVSGHYSAADLQKNFDGALAFSQQLGLESLVCSFPAFKNPARLTDTSYKAEVQALTLEDFRYSAGLFNGWAAKLRAAGIRFAYHNYTMEFRKQDDVVAFDELLRLTDPALVDFELDCGWVAAGGASPEAYLRQYPERITMLHIKDFGKPTQPVTLVNPPPPEELGRGTVDFHALFQAADRARVKHIFVEQEGFNMPPFESIRVDAEYMKAFHG